MIAYAEGVSLRVDVQNENGPFLTSGATESRVVAYASCKPRMVPVEEANLSVSRGHALEHRDEHVRQRIVV